MSNYQVGDIVDVRLTITRDQGNGFFTMKDITTGLHSIPAQSIESLVHRAETPEETIARQKVRIAELEAEKQTWLHGGAA